MRSLHITRKKSFIGSLIPYFVFIGYPKTETDLINPFAVLNNPDTGTVQIKNGQTITLSIQDAKCVLLVGANTSSGIASGLPYLIDEGTDDLNLELTTKYSWIHGSRYHLRPTISNSQSTRRLLRSEQLN